MRPRGAQTLAAMRADLEEPAKGRPRSIERILCGCLHRAPGDRAGLRSRGYWAGVEPLCSTGAGFLFGKMRKFQRGLVVVVAQLRDSVRLLNGALRKGENDQFDVMSVLPHTPSGCTVRSALSFSPDKCTFVTVGRPAWSSVQRHRGAGHLAPWPAPRPVPCLHLALSLTRSGLTDTGVGTLAAR